jgi:hypothetical protein
MQSLVRNALFFVKPKVNLVLLLVVQLCVHTKIYYLCSKVYSSAAVDTRVYTAGYLAIAGSLFSTSKRLLVENNTVPETLCTTHYRLAQKMGTKLGQQLLTTRFPSTKRVPSNAAQWCQRGLPGLGYNVYRPSLRAASCCHLMQYEIRCEYRIVYPIAWAFRGPTLRNGTRITRPAGYGKPGANLLQKYNVCGHPIPQNSQKVQWTYCVGQLL